AANQCGGSLAGPNNNDKTFLCGVYEGLRQRLGVTKITPTLPAACHTVNYVVDRSCVPTLAPGQTLTVAPVVRPLLDLYPLPNLPNDRLTFPFTQPSHDDYVQGRVDHNFSSADRMFARYTFNHTKETDPINYTAFL